MSKHTPGPWSAAKIQDRAAFNIFTPGQCAALLTLEPGKYDGADSRVGNVEADARLIAAAPDLLFQLLAAANYIDALGGDSKSYRAAIAKAEGKD